MYSSFPSLTRNSPVEISKNETPKIDLFMLIAAKKLFVFCDNISSLSATPGVIKSVTPLFTIFLVSFGFSSCSHIATR